MGRSPQSIKLAVLGSGQMAEALLHGFLDSKVLDPASVWATDLNPDRVEHVRNRYGIQVGSDNREAVRWANTILLAVKPQMLSQVMEEVRVFCEHKLVISIAAGISIEWLSKRVPSSVRLVRVMPNAPALVGEGMSVIACGPAVTALDTQLCQSVFAAIGRVVFLEEPLMDVVTGLSGSGPAYACLAIEALSDGGVNMGLPRGVSTLLAAQTMEGAARLVSKPGVDLEQLRQEVSSLSGVTAAGLHQLEQGSIQATLIRAVQAAARKSEELGQKCL